MRPEKENLDFFKNILLLNNNIRFQKTISAFLKYFGYQIFSVFPRRIIYFKATKEGE